MKLADFPESPLRLGLAVFFSRLPFLFNGYGIDPDAWGIALSGLRWAREGVYQASRLPGYPLPEMAASLIGPWAGAVGVNLCSALLAVASVLLFQDVARRLAVPRPGLAALALSFLPAFFLNGICGMDFAWSFFFFMSALWAALQGREVWSGLFLGLAIGSRLTYVAAALPLALIVFQRVGKGKLASILRFGLISIVVGLICFVPVFKVYGLSFFKYYPTPFNLIHFVWKTTIGPFGVLGLVAILVFGTTYFSSPSREVFGGDSWVKAAAALTFMIYLAAWVKLPEDPAYLLPVMPFLFVYAFSRVNLVAQSWICALFVLSPFLFHVYKDGFHLGGPALYDYRRRRDTADYLNQVLARPFLRDASTIIVAGYFDRQIQTIYYERGESMPVNIAGEIDPPELEEWVRQGKRIFFLRGQDEYLRSSRSVNLTGVGAKAL
jgi:hypothetical protein